MDEPIKIECRGRDGYKTAVFVTSLGGEVELRIDERTARRTRRVFLSPRKSHQVAEVLEDWSSDPFSGESVEFQCESSEPSSSYIETTTMVITPFDPHVELQMGEGPGSRLVYASPAQASKIAAALQDATLDL